MYKWRSRVSGGRVSCRSNRRGTCHNEYFLSCVVMIVFSWKVVEEGGYRRNCSKREVVVAEVDS